MLRKNYVDFEVGEAVSVIGTYDRKAKVTLQIDGYEAAAIAHLILDSIAYDERKQVITALAQEIIDEEVDAAVEKCYEETIARERV